MYRTRTMALAAALLMTAGTPARAVATDPTPPIVFVHGNGDSAAIWQTTLWRFESNGWPRARLHAIELPYPLARDDDTVAQAGRTSTAEHMAYLKSEIDKVLKASGAGAVVLIGNSRGGNAIRNYIQTEQASQNGRVNVSHAILGGTPNHGGFAIKGFREGSEFSGTGPFLTGLNAPKNANGDEVAGPVHWMTVRSDSNDKYAQPFVQGAANHGLATNVSYAGPELKGAHNVVIAGIDHRETSFSAPAFAAAYRFITGHAAATDQIVPEAQIELSGSISGLGLHSEDPNGGNYENNLPLAGARLTIYATDSSTGEQGGARLGLARYAHLIGPDGRWGPFKASPGVSYEFEIAARGYATTHIYRSAFPRSSNVVNMHPLRITPEQRAAGAVLTLARMRGYFDAARDQISFDGKPLAGLPPVGALDSESTLVLHEPGTRAVGASFNGERLVGRSWSAAQGHLVVLELTQ